MSETHWITDTPNAFEKSSYVIIHSCNQDKIKRRGVGMIIDKETSKALLDYELYTERMMSVTLSTPQGPLTIFQIYAPDSSYDVETYYQFYDDLDNHINKLPINQKYMVIGDFNAKVGENPGDIWPDNAGKFGLGEMNDRGQYLLQFCATHNLVITNTLFQHKPIRRSTWLHPNGKYRNQIDYILTHQKLKSSLKDSRIYNSASLGTDHSLLMAKFEIAFKQKKKFYAKRVPKKYNVEKFLTDPASVEEFQIKIGGQFEPLLALNDDAIGIDELYTSFKGITNSATKDTVGFRKRKMVHGMPPDLEKLCEQRRNAKLLTLNRPSDHTARDQYKNINKQVKNAVKECKIKALKEQIDLLEEDFKKNNSHNFFKTVRQLESKPRKTLNTIKDRSGLLKTELGEVLACWEEYFKSHLNAEFPHEENAIDSILESTQSQSTEDIITEDEIRSAIKRCKYRKAPGIDEITAEAIRSGGEPMVRMLHKILRKIWKTETPPTDWSKLLISPIYKKGDRLLPSNYRAISLLSIPGKILSQILLDRMKRQTEKCISESQFGFRPGRGTIDAIFVTRQILEKAKEHNLNIHLNLIDFKAAFDTIWRKALWKMMRSIGVDPKIVSIIENLYKDTECAIVIDGNMTKWFRVNVGVRQGCLLSPTLFNIFLDFVMAELKSVQTKLSLNENLSCDIRYADDTTLISSIFEMLQLSTTELENACKKWGMKINTSKTKILSSDDGEITIDGDLIENTDSFVYLGSVIPGTTADITRRTALAAQAFGRLQEAIWKNRDVSIPLKARLYNALIVPIATYASETWTLTEKDKQLLNTFEMRCLRCMLRVSLLDRLRNDVIRERLGIKKSIVHIVKSKRLKWFGHVVRRHPTGYVNTAYREDFTKKRLPGRPKKRWRDQIREDLKLPVRTAERVAEDREGWKKLIGENGARILRGLCR